MQALGEGTASVLTCSSTCTESSVAISGVQTLNSSEYSETAASCQTDTGSESKGRERVGDRDDSQQNSTNLCKKEQKASMTVKTKLLLNRFQVADFHCSQIHSL